MNFMEAYEKMKNGWVVRRKEWNKKLVMWIELENNDFCKIQMNDVVEYNYIMPNEIEANDWEVIGKQTNVV